MHNTQIPPSQKQRYLPLWMPSTKKQMIKGSKVSLSIAICKERAKGENRVAATPETVKKLIALGATVHVEKGAGKAASYLDDDYKQAGAKLGAAASITKSADILLCVQRPDASILKGLKSGASVVGALSPYDFSGELAQYKKSKLTAIAMELMPRITRAQSMDILSSQANLAGYRCVLDAAHEFGRAFPMMMTAAGTVSPARVFVMGAGVAGLQAIATARRLGAVVSATDVRPAAKEQVESLGATFVMVENEETKAAETDGGYAKEMSANYKKQQAQLVADTIKKQDIVICTALIPGRPAPVLVSEDMVKTMKAGSVIVDLAVAQGGNCPLSEAGKIVEKHDVKIIGYDNMASRIAVDASALYARNLLTFLSSIISEDGKSITIDIEEEIMKAVALTHKGQAVHSLFAPAPKKVAAKKTTKKAPAKAAAKTKAKPKAKTATKKATTAKTAVKKKAAPKKAAAKTTTKKAAAAKTAKKTTKPAAKTKKEK